MCAEFFLVYCRLTPFDRLPADLLSELLRLLQLSGKLVSTEAVALCCAGGQLRELSLSADRVAGGDRLPSPRLNDAMLSELARWSPALVRYDRVRRCSAEAEARRRE
jgi:hypothetical protein